MGELILYAIPAFVLLTAVEAASYIWGDHDHDHQGYEGKDTATSLSMGLGSVIIGAGWRLAVIAAYAGIYELSPFHLPTDTWWPFLLLVFAEDLAFYWYHRVGHEVRVFWAAHVVHHSSVHFNLSTALRQPWVEMAALPFWLPLALFFAPWMILTQQAISLIYQFGLHTERIGRLPRPIELIFNTPSHHRVHHGSNSKYLDRNYGGILIIWDRLFGSFQGEEEKVVYGLTKNIGTHNPLKVALHEWQAIWVDVKSARNWRDRLGYCLRGPGWQPGTAADIRFEQNAERATTIAPPSLR